MSYEQYLAVLHNEVAAKLGWTLNQSTLLVGDATHFYESGATTDQAVQRILDTMFDD